MSAVLPLEAPAPVSVLPNQLTSALAEIIHCAYSLEETRDSLVTILPKLEDEQIQAIRDKAREVGTWSWVTECACDSEMLRRIDARRGKADANGCGRDAAVNREAYLRGQSRTTIYRNARIFNEFLESTSAGTNLLEKGFYDAALRAPHPKRALSLFAEKKADSAFFSPRDAYRLADTLKREARARAAHREMTKTARALADVRARAMRAHIDHVIFVIRNDFKPNCPDPEFSRRIYDSWIEDLETEREDVGFNHDLREAIYQALKDGVRITSQIVETVREPKEDVETELERMRAAGIVEQIKQGGKTDVGRGDRPKVWRVVQEPTGDAFEMPRAGSNYEDEGW